VDDLLNEIDSNFGEGTYNLMPEFMQPMLNALPDERIGQYLSSITEDDVRSLIANINVEQSTAMGVNLRFVKGAMSLPQRDVVEWTEALGYNDAAKDVAEREIVPMLGTDLWGFMVGKDTLQNVGADSQIIIQSLKQG
jgi:hypothetical protein